MMRLSVEAVEDSSAPHLLMHHTLVCPGWLLHHLATATASQRAGLLSPSSSLCHPLVFLTWLSRHPFLHHHLSSCWLVVTLPPIVPPSHSTWLIVASPLVAATITHLNQVATLPSIVLLLPPLIAIALQTLNPIASTSCHHSHCRLQQSWQLQCRTLQSCCCPAAVAPPLLVLMLLVLLLIVKLLLLLLLPLEVLWEGFPCMKPHELLLAVLHRVAATATKTGGR
jgi:hypothetical protein